MVMAKIEFVCKSLRQSLFNAYQFLIFSVVAYKLEKRKKQVWAYNVKVEFQGVEPGK